MPTFRFTINGQERVINAVPDMPLLWVLRDLLQLTGTKYGCGAEYAELVLFWRAIARCDPARSQSLRRTATATPPLRDFPPRAAIRANRPGSMKTFPNAGIVKRA